MRELAREKSTNSIVPVLCLYKPVGGFLVSLVLSFTQNTSLVLYRVYYLLSSSIS